MWGIWHRKKNTPQIDELNKCIQLIRRLEENPFKKSRKEETLCGRIQWNTNIIQRFERQIAIIKKEVTGSSSWDRKLQHSRALIQLLQLQSQENGHWEEESDAPRGDDGKCSRFLTSRYVNSIPGGLNVAQNWDQTDMFLTSLRRQRCCEV